MLRKILIPIVLTSFVACHGHHHDEHVVVAQSPEPRLVSIEVEVFDPISGLVWENVGVRIVEAYNEWSDCTCVSPFDDDWHLTDLNGIVFLSESRIADADVGFVEDTLQRALIEPELDSDSAVVTLEVGAEEGSNDRTR